MKSTPVNVAIFNDTNLKSPGHYGSSLVMNNLVEKLRKNNLNPVFFWPVGIDWRNKTSIIKNNSDFAAIIVNGEGSIHSNRSKGKPNYIVEIAQFAKNELNLPAYLVNSTLHNNTPDLYEKIKHFKHIYVRESSSYNVLKNANIESVIVPDLTFSTPIAKKEETNGELSWIITDSTNNDLRKYLKNKSVDFDMEYISMKVDNEFSPLSRFFNKCHRFAKKKNLKILENIFLMPEKTEKTIKQLPGIFKKPHSNSFKPHVDYDWFIEKIKSSRFVVTGRFHTVTICIKAETPFVALESNTPKISALLDDIFGSQERLITKKDLDKFGNDIPDKFLKYSETELEAIRKFNTKAMVSIDQMIKSIATDIHLNNGYH
jgi:polysaccharide pyruvyl transferase WcaK-like protein